MARTESERKVALFQEAPIRPGLLSGRPKGRALIIGGREDRTGDRFILRYLARHLGNRKLVVATVASQEPEALWGQYRTAFRGIGVRHVYRLDLRRREEGQSARKMRILEDAGAIFFTGGDQLRITSTLSDTPLYSRIQEIFLEGGVIAGTSAGASVLSDTMMVGGGGEESHRIKSELHLAPGFGFVRDVVIDQHFAERGRIGRLLGVVGQNPRVLGLGIDENTAIDYEPQRGFRVIGAGGVTVVDGHAVTATNVAEDERDRTMSIFGVTLHVLSQSDHFDLRTRRPTMTPARVAEVALDGNGTPLKVNHKGDGARSRANHKATAR